MTDKREKPSDRRDAEFKIASNRADLRPSESQNTGWSLENHYKATFENDALPSVLDGAPEFRPIAVSPEDE